MYLFLIERPNHQLLSGAGLTAMQITVFLETCISCPLLHVRSYSGA